MTFFWDYFAAINLTNLMREKIFPRTHIFSTPHIGQINIFLLFIVSSCLNYDLKQGTFFRRNHPVLCTRKRGPIIPGTSCTPKIKIKKQQNAKNHICDYYCEIHSLSTVVKFFYDFCRTEHGLADSGIVTTKRRHELHSNLNRPPSHLFLAPIR